MILCMNNTTTTFFKYWGKKRNYIKSLNSSAIEHTKEK